MSKMFSNTVSDRFYQELTTLSLIKITSERALFVPIMRSIEAHLWYVREQRLLSMKPETPTDKSKLPALPLAMNVQTFPSGSSN